VAHGKPFAQLAPAQQDDVITALEHDRPNNFTWPSAQAFFAMLRTHTMEGMFADPVYGGNKDFSGWRLVGFPGAQPPQPISSERPCARRPVHARKCSPSGPRKVSESRSMRSLAAAAW
jgi:gluconate 2-dehydrogenase gamma chain